MVSKRTLKRREKERAFQEKIRERDWDWYLTFFVDNRQVAEYSIDKQGEHAKAKAAFEIEHPGVRYTTSERHVDMG